MASRRAVFRLLQATTRTQLRPARPLAALSRPPRNLSQQWSSHIARPSQAVGARSYSQASQSSIWNFEDVQKLTQHPKANVVIVDTREPSEIQQTGRIPGAVNVPITSAPDSFHISEDEFEDRFGYARPDRDAEVVFYCKAGVRSRAAAGLAREAGWTHVAEYPGSWLDWAGKGGKVER